MLSNRWWEDECFLPNVGVVAHVPYAMRCNASLHCLAARGTRPNTAGC
jgi:hypothetical protein